MDRGQMEKRAPQQPEAKNQRLFVSLGLVAALMMTVFAANAGAEDISDPEAYFRNLEEKLMSAVMERNQTVMEMMIGDDYLLTSSDSNGGLIGKTGYIAGSMDPSILTAEGFEFTSLSVQEIDDDAVIVRSQLDWQSTYRGRPWNAEFLMTDVWVLRSGQWKLISRHSSYPAGALPQIVKDRYSDN